MPINTKNSGLTGGQVPTGRAWIRLLRRTRVSSIGRDAEKGERVEVSAEDARFLVAYNYAEGCQQPEARSQKPEVSDQPEKEVEESSSSSVLVAPESSSSSVLVAPESSASGIKLAIADDEPVRRFRRRRDK